MKTMISLVVLMLVWMIAGCGSDSTTGNSTPNGSVSATVDGGSWSATTVSATSPAGNLMIVGSQISGASSKQFSIQVVGAKTGDFQLGGVNGALGTLITYTEGEGTTVKTYSSKEGKISITEFTATGAKGTFTTTVEHNQAGQSDGTTHTVTNGSFDVKF